MVKFPKVPFTEGDIPFEGGIEMGKITWDPEKASLVIPITGLTVECEFFLYRYSTTRAERKAGNEVLWKQGTSTGGALLIENWTAEEVKNFQASSLSLYYNEVEKPQTEFSPGGTLCSTHQHFFAPKK